MNSGKNVKKLSDADCEKGEFEWSPDSKSMLWNCSDHKLRLATVETGETKIVASNDVGDLDSPAFSPDGKWISYAKEDKLLRSHVFVMQLDGGTERMITSPEFLMSTGAQWTRRRQEAAGAGRGRHSEAAARSADGGTYLSALQHRVDACRQGSERSRHQHRGPSGSSGRSHRRGERRLRRRTRRQTAEAPRRNRTPVRW